MPKETNEWKSLDIVIERLDGETPAAYQAFLKFAWLQGKERSHENVAEQLGFSVSQASLWCATNKWLDRAAQVDAVRWKYEFAQREKFLEKDNLQFASDNREIQTSGLKAAKGVLRVVTNMIAKAELNDEVIETGFVRTEDGRDVPTTTTIHMKAKISDIPRLLESAVRVANLVQGLPTEIIENNVAVGGDLSNLKDDEIIALREKIHRDLRERGAASKIEMISNEAQ